MSLMNVLALLCVELEGGDTFRVVNIIKYKFKGHFSKLTGCHGTQNMYLILNKCTITIPRINISMLQSSISISQINILLANNITLLEDHTFLVVIK